MTHSKFDVIIVGAGHNGLVAANYLAKAGKKVLVLERREQAGGQLAAGSFDGQAFDPLHAGAQLRPDIVRDLDLGRFGLADPGAVKASYTSLLPDGRRLHLSTSPGDAQTLEWLDPATGAQGRIDTPGPVRRVTAASGRQFIAEVERGVVLFGASANLWLYELP